MVGHGLGLLGISFSYLTMYKPKGDPQCTGSMGTACDIARFIFFFFTAIYASDLIGLPWDALVLWATNSLPDDSPTFHETWFQLAVFGSLALNLLLILIGEGAILVFIVDYLMENWSTLFPSDVNPQPTSSLRYLLQQSFVMSFIAHFPLIPQYVQLVSTGAYSYFVYQNQLGV